MFTSRWALAGVGRLADGLDHLIGDVVIDGQLDLDLGQEIHHVLCAAVELRVTLLATEALDLDHGDAGSTDDLDRLLDGAPGRLSVFLESGDVLAG